MKDIQGPSMADEESLFDEIMVNVCSAEAEADYQARHHSVAAHLVCSCCLMQAPQAIDMESEPPSGSVPADSVAPVAVPEQAANRRA